jgi:hypothetical protein
LKTGKVLAVGRMIGAGDTMAGLGIAQRFN